MNTPRSHLHEILHYGAGSLLMLAAKIGLMQGAIALLSELTAYAVVQVLVFVGSYLLHARITFDVRLSLRGLLTYLRTMIVFQTLDWLVFAVAFTRLGIDSVPAILTATAVVFVIRFLFVRRTLRGAEDPC